MKFHVGGARGSRVMTGTEMSIFGGDTTAFLIEGEGGECLLIDGGSGLRTLESRLVAFAGSPVHMLFTHYHLDHLIGLPCFERLVPVLRDLTLAGPVFDHHDPTEILAALMSPPYWPAPVDKAELALVCRGLDPANGMDGLMHGGLHYRWSAMAHPGGSLAYRIDEAATGQSLVVATDVEWARCDPAQRQGLRALCTSPGPAQWLVMDGQYDEADYHAHAGWGHSTWQEAVALACACGVSRLAITHHDSGAVDDALVEREQQVREAHGSALLLRQGHVLTL